MSPVVDWLLSGIAGTQINAKRDLGFTDKRMPSLEVFLQPAAGHKFRLQYIPIKFEASSTVTRDIVFNGQRYRIGIPVDSTLKWNAVRFGYEFDFVRKNRGFAGFIIEGKYTDVQVELTSPAIGLTEFARARAPIPALGGIGRFYVVPNISITGELTAFTLPTTIEGRYGGHYVDLDIYGTVNFTKNVGLKGGYRLLDMYYLVKQDIGSFVMRGIYLCRRSILNDARGKSKVRSLKGGLIREDGWLVTIRSGEADFCVQTSDLVNPHSRRHQPFHPAVSLL